MSADKDLSRPEGRRLSRRAMIRLGLLSVPASQLPLGWVLAAAAQPIKPGAQLIGKLEGGSIVGEI